MRVLFLSGQLPYPPHAGGALRIFGLLDGLHKAGHTIDLMTFSEPGQPDPATTPLASLCGEIRTVSAPARKITDRLRDLLLTRQADMARRSYSEDFIEALKAQLGQTQYDVVHMESLEMATYLPAIREAAPSVPVIYDSFNAEFDLQRLISETDRRELARLPGAIYSFIQWRRLMQFEGDVCRRSNAVIAVSEADAQAFRKLIPGVKVYVVPNGIYASEYQSKPSQQLELGLSTLLFTGTMNYRPNVDAVLWFVDNVLDQIREAVPDVRLFVAGNKPHGRLNALRQRSDVEITGYVQDMLPFLHGTTVYIAPLRMGSGTRLKLLQAMAAGCAIVSTSLGAQGLAITPGCEMQIADDAPTFAQAVIELLRNPDRRVQMGQAAQALVCKEYDWSAILPRLLKLYQEMGIE